MGTGSDQSSVRSWLVQPISVLSSAAGLCAGRGRALIRQLAYGSLSHAKNGLEKLAESSIFQPRVVGRFCWNLVGGCSVGLRKRRYLQIHFPSSSRRRHTAHKISKRFLTRERATAPPPRLSRQIVRIKQREAIYILYFYIYILWRFVDGIIRIKQKCLQFLSEHVQ